MAWYILGGAFKDTLLQSSSCVHNQRRGGISQKGGVRLTSATWKARAHLSRTIFLWGPPILVAPMQITDVNSLDECPLLYSNILSWNWKMFWFWALRSWERGLTPPLLVFASLYLPHSAWVALGQNRSNTCFTDWDHPRPLRCCFFKMSLP